MRGEAEVRFIAGGADCQGFVKILKSQISHLYLCLTFACLVFNLTSQENKCLCQLYAPLNAFLWHFVKLKAIHGSYLLDEGTDDDDQGMAGLKAH